jgi:hypothetical protein
VGRFINEDPSGFKGGDTNLFRSVSFSGPEKSQMEGVSGSLQWRTRWRAITCERIIVRNQAGENSDAASWAPPRSNTSSGAKPIAAAATALAVITAASDATTDTAATVTHRGQPGWQA